MFDLRKFVPRRVFKHLQAFYAMSLRQARKYASYILQKCRKYISWKAAVPFALTFLLLLMPAPDTMPPQAWRYFAVFLGMIVAMISEQLPPSAIGFITVTFCIIGAKWFLFGAEELADPAFRLDSEALKWGLAGFSNSTVWLVFGAFMFALGYEITGLGRRMALFLVKFMGRSTLTLGYAIVIIDVLLAPFMPSNTARTGGTVFPIIKNLPPLFQSFPNDPSARRIGGYLMWMLIIATSVSSSMFMTASAPNMLAAEFVGKIADMQISWEMWFLSFLPAGIILLAVAPWLAYMLYKPEVTHSEEVAEWAKEELKKMPSLSRKETLLIALVLLSLCLWIFGAQIINATVVGLLAVSLMLLLQIVSWKDITRDSNAWNTLINLATLITMANGLARSGFIDWFSVTMSAHMADFSPHISIIILVLFFYFSHYLFASLSAHTAVLLPVILAIGKNINGISIEQLSLLLVLSIGIMGCLTPYATGPGVIIYGSGYIKSRDYWRLGAIFGAIFIILLLAVGWPILALWN